MRCGAALAGGDCIANPATGRCFYCDRELRPDPRIAAARRIKRALLAEADRAAGIDTRKLRPRIASLPGLRAQFHSRDDLPMRVIADMLDEAEPMLELLARVQAIVEKVDGVDFTEAGEHEHACQLIEAIRTTLETVELYPPHESPPAPSDTVPSYPGERGDFARLAGNDPNGIAKLECRGCRRQFNAGDAYQLRVKGKLFAFHPGQFCPECAARYDRGELVL
jgi:hypothetical protein